VDVVGEIAVLVLDMFNPYDHEDAELLAPGVEQVVDPLASLIPRAGERDDVDLIYVNDNHGDFTVGREQIVQRALEGERPDLVKPFVPASDRMFLIKVRHSAFFSTPLDYLLGRLGTRRVVITGQVTEQCVLYTALDAYVRHLEIRVPPDAVAHIDPELGSAALRMMASNMRAELCDIGHCLD
jgi:nicotinamidase-related amidase